MNEQGKHVFPRKRERARERECASLSSLVTLSQALDRLGIFFKITNRLPRLLQTSDGFNH